MEPSIAQKRRAFLKASAGGLGAFGLTGLGLASVSSANAQAATLDGLKPLYSKNHNQKAAVSAGLETPSDLPMDAVRALRRLCFGYRPQDLTDFQALGANFDDRLQAYADDQLAGYQAGYPPSNDSALSAVLNEAGTNFTTLNDSLTTLWQERVVNDPGWPYYQYPLIETQYLALLRATHSKWQLAEVLADFWHTHFSVQGDKFEVAPVLVHCFRGEV